MVDQIVPATKLEPKNSLMVDDLTQADTNVHYITGLASLLGTSKVVKGVLISVIRVSGTGQFFVYNNEGSFASAYSTDPTLAVIESAIDRIKYSLTVANDVFDIYAYAYITD